ncbi:hypothetical protein CHU32_06130 [Superficieibacter electus]|uniref:Uncharacterized protein n=1 Tax=Superficieibacter electus TaxID=2022662 RepID=A0A2P5GTC8_9ENTR|nr:hypothetical protein CHU33_06115 [Superficieibacter electus]POP49801.1 hypothetical protein CHU32_06130 [Superficieibacter electus]
MTDAYKYTAAGCLTKFNGCFLLMLNVFSAKIKNECVIFPFSDDQFIYKIIIFCFQNDLAGSIQT